MRKKLIAIVLLAAMVLSLAACGDKKKPGTIAYEVSDEPVTIKYYYANGSNGVEQYTQQVEDKLNEILHGMDGYEHITIELHPGASYSRDLMLAQSTGEQIDLVSTYGLDTSTMIVNGDFIPLDGLMEQFPDATSELPDWIVDYGKVNGTQYYIPTYQQAANLTYFLIPQEYVDMYMKAYNKTRDDISNAITHGTMDDKLDFLEDLVLAVRDATHSKTKWIFPTEYWADNLLSNVFFNQEYIANQQFGNYILREGADGPEYWGYTEDFKKLMERFAKWYKEGLLHNDCTSVNYHKFVGTNFLNDEAYVNWFKTDTCTEEYMENYYSEEYGIPMAAFRVTDHAYIPSEWEAGGHAIYADCEHPAEAMMIIELLRSKKGKEFYNTLVYGLEGIHWQWEDKENDRIITLEYDGPQGGTTYTCYKWNTGNVFNAWKNQSVKDGFYEYIVDGVEKGADTVFSPAMGIFWDTSNIKNQMIQVNAVQGEYGKTIYVAKDWEARYNEYIDKLKKAGIQDILDEFNRQYQEHLKSKQ